MPDALERINGLLDAARAQAVSDLAAGLSAGVGASTGFLGDLLGRPPNERPFILFPVGWPAADCVVPELRRKSLEEVAIFLEG